MSSSFSHELENIHALSKYKNDYTENYELTDTPLEVCASCTISADTLKAIKDKKGAVLKFSQMIDGYDDFLEDLEKTIAFSYIPHDKPYSLKFLLRKLDIEDIQSPSGDKSNLLLGGTLAMPDLHGIGFPTDHTNGRYKKIFDLSGTRHYMNGKPHGFVHTLKDANVNKTYNLISQDSVINTPILFPGNNVVNEPGEPLLYTHKVNNKSMYEGSNYPQGIEYIRPSGTDSFKNSVNVKIPKECYMRAWHKTKPQFDSEGGACTIPLELHVKSCHTFLENINHHRSTTFKDSGIWFDIDQLDPSLVKCKLKFLIHPIVPISENKASTPYINYKHGMQKNLQLVVKQY